MAQTDLCMCICLSKYFPLINGHWSLSSVMSTHWQVINCVYDKMAVNAGRAVAVGAGFGSKGRTLVSIWMRSRMVKSPAVDRKILKRSNAAPDATVTWQTPAPLLLFDVEGGGGERGLHCGGHPCSTGMLAGAQRDTLEATPP